MNSLCKVVAFGLGCALIGAALAVKLLSVLGARGSLKERDGGCLPNILFVSAILMAVCFYVLASAN